MVFKQYPYNINPKYKRIANLIFSRMFEDSILYREHIQSLGWFNLLLVKCNDVTYVERYKEDVCYMFAELLLEKESFYNDRGYIYDIELLIMEINEGAYRHCRNYHDVVIRRNKLHIAIYEEVLKYQTYNDPHTSKELYNQLLETGFFKREAQRTYKSYHQIREWDCFVFDEVNVKTITDKIIKEEKELKAQIKEFDIGKDVEFEEEGWCCGCE